MLVVNTFRDVSMEQMVWNYQTRLTRFVQRPIDIYSHGFVMILISSKIGHTRLVPNSPVTWPFCFVWSFQASQVRRRFVVIIVRAP